MKTDEQLKKPEAEAFLAEARKLAEKFAWTHQDMKRKKEVVLVARIDADDSFERFVWIYDTHRTMLKCMLVGRVTIPVRKLGAVLKLCALVNEGLPFGCLEYSFGERILVFRDSADMGWGPLAQVVVDVTERTLNLGRRYADAIQAVLEGTNPQEAVGIADKP
ncbi:hypothetical protein [Hymenobacter negativus]|uniref:YbjN domain-containing protein n=1 Tax=Hymenobacter negativus TaxID=2795026 RepID=A0ABS3QKL3_9BACT|nr:hypothetical protein [Hymenobacter negativus]MBO2011553.1 hypothetical protein [Hymenobacter negativus]